MAIIKLLQIIVLINMFITLLNKNIIFINFLITICDNLKE